MANVLSLLFSVLFCFTAAGCSEDTSTTQVQPQPEKRVVFNLPEGWEWAGGGAESGDAIKWHDREDPQDFYKIGDFTFEPGDEALAEAKAKEGFAGINRRQCETIPCNWKNEYVDYTDTSHLEVKTIGNHKMFVISNYMDMNDTPFWGHGLILLKDGIVYNGAIFGAEFETFKQPLQTILDSIRVE